MPKRRTAILIATLTTTAALVTGCGGDEPAPAAPAADSAGALALLPGTAESNNAAKNTGDWAYPEGGPALAAQEDQARKWTGLQVSKAGNLDPVVVNSAGFTLYRFDDDDAKPSKSVCSGECAKTWPPVSVSPGSKVFVSGVAADKIDFLTRDDGTLQITIGGWPVYRFSKDTRPGDTNGQGVKGTWFGVTPDGQRAKAEAEPDNGVEVIEESGASPVTLFDDKGFAQTGSVMGISGSECQDVSVPDVTSSVKTAGTLRMWADKDCNGEVREITGDVTDLAVLGFDDTVASVRIV